MTGGTSDFGPAYKIEISPAAARQLRKLDGIVQRRVLTVIDRLAVEPRPAGVKALVGHPNLLRLRVGDYRIVYTVHDGQLVVVVIAAAHRREICRDL
ncbi:MAG TPA: type II toxin-antitoxin system RelE/ParE family toxin [Micromonospora sp.]|nr:type II toxin-antitoxin system RelE/ParE family toxin [Micromonospora sp.]